jgi:hypothetical protein
MKLGETHEWLLEVDTHVCECERHFDAVRQPVEWNGVTINKNNGR